MKKRLTKIVRLTFGILTALSAPQSQAAILFQNDTFGQVYSDSILINSDDGASGNFGITFGSSLAESLNWNSSSSRFDLSDDLNISGGLEISNDLDFNANEMLEARMENLSSAGTCNSTYAGQLYYNTSSKRFYHCDETAWLAAAPLVLGHFYDATGSTDLDTATPTAIAFDTETREDTGITHSTSSNTSRVILDNAGWYEVNYGITHSNGTIGVGNIHCRVRLNGTTNVTSSDSYVVDTVAFTSKATNIGTALFQTTSASEYYEIMCFNNGSSVIGSLNTSANESWTMVERL